MLTVTHKKVSAKADDPVASANGEVLPSDWNDTHEIVGSYEETYTNLIADYSPTDDDAGSVFTNSSAPSLINIDFSGASALKSFQFMVTDASGFNLVSTGTFYISGQPISGDVSSTTLGSVVKATIISATQIILQTDGVWEYA